MKKLLTALFALCLAGSMMASELTWMTSLPDAQAKAKKEHKLVFMNFTGSDWCGWCKKMDAETFSKPEFADYAKKNLVLVELDFPTAKKPQSDDLKAANAALKSKYEIHGFPTMVAVNADGSVAWKNEGYLEGGPSALIAKLDAVTGKAGLR